MKEESLLNLLKEIQEECTNQQIALFPGTFEDENLTVVEYSDSGPEDWKKFLRFFTLSDAKFLILTKRYNTSKGKELEKMISHSKKITKAFKPELDMLSQNNGKLAFFTLSFIVGSVCYSHKSVADWALNYLHHFEQTGMYEDPVFKIIGGRRQYVDDIP